MKQQLFSDIEYPNRCKRTRREEFHDFMVLSGEHCQLSLPIKGKGTLFYLPALILSCVPELAEAVIFVGFECAHFRGLP